jgi:hypothetical protein
VTESRRDDFVTDISLPGYPHYSKRHNYFGRIQTGKADEPHTFQADCPEA